MPVYQFRCEKCNKKFDVKATIAEYEEKNFKCPKCNSKKVKQELTVFNPSTSKHVHVPRDRSANKKRKKVPWSDKNIGW